MTPTQQIQFLDLLLRLQHSGPGYPPFEQTGITPAQFAYLDCVASHALVTQQEIAFELSVSAASASIALKHLEESGLLLREPNPADGRSFCFTLSPAGSEVHAIITRYRQQKAQALLDHLSESEQTQFLALFEQLLSPTQPILERKD